MKAAYKRGVNFFDNAETYAAGEAERIMGEAIQIGVTNGDWTREDLVVSTKIFFGTRSGPNNVGLSRKHIIEGVGERPRAGRPPPHPTPTPPHPHPPPPAHTHTHSASPHAHCPVLHYWVGVAGTRASLKRLQLDYVDLMFCHRPDPLTPIEETVRAMSWLVDQGLAFYWGTSEWSAAQLTEVRASFSDLEQKQQQLNTGSGSDV